MISLLGEAAQKNILPTRIDKSFLWLYPIFTWIYNHTLYDCEVIYK